MEIVKIEESKIEKTDFNNIDKLVYQITLYDGSLGFRLLTTRPIFNIETYKGLESLYTIFVKLVNDVKRSENIDFIADNKDTFVVLKNDNILFTIINQIKPKQFYEDIYATMPEGYLVDSDLEAKAQFKAKFVCEDNNFFCYDIVYSVEKSIEKEIELL